MKNLLFILLGLILFSCKPNIPRQDHTEVVQKDTIFIYKDVYIEKDFGSAKTDSLKSIIIKKDVDLSKLIKSNDSLKIANNLLGKKLLHSQLIITNAKYYLDIANRKESQRKFLRGWMNRALNQ